MPSKAPSSPPVIFSRMRALLDLNGNTGLALMATLLAIWLCFFFLFPNISKDEDEKIEERRRQTATPAQELRVPVSAVEGFDVSSFIELLRNGKLRVINGADNQPCQLQLTANEFTLGETSATGLQSVQLLGEELVQVQFDKGVLAFKCETADDKTLISQGLASLASALASDPKLLDVPSSPLKIIGDATVSLITLPYNSITSLFVETSVGKTETE